jgi:predicted DNA-binding transcriptional regulator YafY
MIEEVTIIYRNWKGEIRERRIVPYNIFFGTTVWHDQEPQWFLTATDVEKNAIRKFAMKDIRKWGLK